MPVSVLLMIGALVVQTGALASSPSAQPTPAASKSLPVSMTFASKAKRAPATYEPQGGLILLKATVAGREVWALLDTGAERSLIDIELARAAGLTIGPPEGTIRTSTGTIPKRRVSHVTISIANQLETQAPAVGGMDMAPISKIIGRKIEFVLGAEYLNMMQVMVDPGRRTINLLPSGAAKPPENFPSITLYPGSLIEVMVGDKPVRIKIDTGFNGGLHLSPEAWARVGPPKAQLDTHSVAGAEGQTYMADFARAPKVTIGSVVRKDVKVNVSPWPAAKGDGAIGMGLLGQFFFVLDVKAGTLWLAPRLSSSSGG